MPPGSRSDPGQPGIGHRRHVGIVRGDEVGQRVDPQVDSPCFRALHDAAKAVPAGGKPVVEVEVSPVLEGLRVVQVAQARAPGPLDRLVRIVLAEVEDQVGGVGRPGGLSPLAVDHRMRKPLGDLDRPQRLDRAIRGRTEQGDLRPDCAPVVECRGHVPRLAPVLDDAVRRPIARVRLQRAPEVLGLGSLDPVQDVAALLPVEVAVVSGLEQIDLRREVVVPPGQPTQRLRVQGLDSDGESRIPHNADGLTDRLRDGGGVRSPHHELDGYIGIKRGQIEM